MTDPLGGDRYRELEFDRGAGLVRPEQVDGVGTLAGRVDDLIVLCHGWNNDIDDARGLYRSLVGSIDAQRAAGREPGLSGRTVGFVGVFWPSKKFTDEDLIPGGAAGAGDEDPMLAADLLARADAFAVPDAERTLAKAAALVPRLRFSPKAQGEYADLLRSLVDPAAVDADEGGPAFLALDGREVYRRADDPTLGDPELISPAPDPGTSGGAQEVPVSGAPGAADGGAAGLLSGLRSAGRQLLNLVTYYEMKNRAGQVGAALGPVLAEQVAGRARLHLVGHSFGARLATAAADVMTADAVASMSLLQAAFSHYGFAKDWEPGRDGAYRAVLAARKLAGPMIVTHTRRDRAVGLAYAIASRVAGQVAASIGDAESRFGGLGGNGAQRTPEVEPGRLLDPGTPYQLARRRIHNLLADDFVSGHGDVTNRPVAHAVLAAVAAGG